MSRRVELSGPVDLLDEAEFFVDRYLSARFAMRETRHNAGFYGYWLRQACACRAEARMAAEAHLGVLLLVQWFSDLRLTPGPSDDWLLPSDN